MSDSTPDRDLGETLGETESETPTVPHGNALPLTSESVLRLVEEEGLSYERAGERLGVSRSTVYRRLKQARAERDGTEEETETDETADLRDLRGSLEDTEEPDDWNCGTCGAPVRWRQPRCRCGTALDWSAV